MLTPVQSNNDDHTTILAYDTYDSQRTIRVESPDARSALFGHLSQETTVSYDSDGYDGSDELTPPTPHQYAIYIIKTRAMHYTHPIILLLCHVILYRTLLEEINNV